MMSFAIGETFPIRRGWDVRLESAGLPRSLEGAGRWMRDEKVGRITLWGLLTAQASLTPSQFHFRYMCSGLQQYWNANICVVSLERVCPFCAVGFFVLLCFPAPPKNVSNFLELAICQWHCTLTLILPGFWSAWLMAAGPGRKAHGRGRDRTVFVS